MKNFITISIVAKSVFVLIMIFCSVANAQVATDFSFVSSSGTYTPFTGGTVLGTTSNDGQVFNNSTTGGSGPVSNTGFGIGFSFIYNGNAFDKFAVSTDGWVQLGTGTFSIPGGTTPLSTVGRSSIVSPFGLDLQGQSYTTPGTLTTTSNSITGITAGKAAVGMTVSGTGIPTNTVVTGVSGTTITISANATVSGTQTLTFGSTLQYKTVGTSMVIQWAGYRRFAATVGTENLNFQVILTQTTNTVEFVYGVMKVATTYTPQVGIIGDATTDFFNRTSTTSWASTSAGGANTNTVTITAAIFPATGLTYTYTPITYYISTVSDGDWNTAATWSISTGGSGVPTAGSKVIVDASFPVGTSVAISAQPASIRVKSILTLNNSYTNPSSSTITVDTSGKLVLGATLTNSGTTTVNGILQINNDGNVDTNSPTYTTGSTLSFTTGAVYDVGSGNKLWAIGTSGAGIPDKIEINASGTNVNINEDRTVRSLVSVTAGTLTNNSNILNIATSVTTAATALNINGGTLTNAGGTINIGVTNGGNQTLSLAGGALTLSSGTINLNGNFSRPTGGGTFNQSGGLLSIDGNSGTLGTSTASGVILFNVVSATGTGLNCTAGTIRIVDPPHSSTSATRSLYLTYGTTAPSNYQFSGTHTFEFGDGSSTTGGNSLGFVIDTKGGSYRIPLQNVIVNAGATANRWVSTAFTAANSTNIQGDLTINANSEFRNTFPLADFSVNGNIANAGTFTSSQTLILASTPVNGGVPVAATTAQTINGIGTYRNLAASPTAKFSNITFNNSTTGAAVTFGIGDVTLTGTATLTSGIIDVGNNNSFNFVSTSSAVSGGSPTAFVLIQGTGQMKKDLSGSTNFTFHVGENTGTTEYSPASLNFTALSPASTIGVRPVDGATATTGHPNLNDVDAQSDYISRWWQVSNSAATTYTYTGTFTYLPADVNGDEATIKVNLWNGSSPWKQAISAAAANVMTISTALTQATGPLSATADFTGRVKGGTIYTWDGSTSSAWTTATNWTPDRNIPSTNDVLVFNGATVATPTVTSVPTQTIGQLKLTNNVNVTLQSAAAITLTMSGGSGTDLDIPTGSHLRLGSTGTNSINLAYTGTQTANIAGQLSLLTNTSNNNTYTVTNSTTTVTGTLNNFGVVAGSTTSNLLFTTGTYNHNYTSTYGTIPTAGWTANTSTCAILGYTSPAAGNVPTGINQTFGNFTWNTSSLSTIPNLGGTTITAAGTFTMASTGSASLRLGSASNGAILCTNFTQNGGTIDMSAGSGIGTIQCSETFNQSAGTITESSTGSGTIEFTGTSGQSVTVLGSILDTINIKVSNPSGIAVSGTLPLNAGTTFTAASSGTAVTSGTVTYSTATTLAYVTTVGIQTTGNEFPATGGPVDLTINNTFTTPNVFLTGSKTILGNLTFIAGNLDLNGSNNITLGSLGNIVGESNSSRLINSGSPSATNGYIETTRTLGTNPGNVGNLGLIISSAGAMDSTVIKRFPKVVSGIPTSLNSISRVYSIQPTTASSASTIALSYFDSELNSNTETAPSMVTFNSTGANETIAANYVYIGATATDATANTVTYNAANLTTSNTFWTCLSTNRYETAQNGDWNTGSTWIGNTVPPVNADVTIKHTVTVATADPNTTNSLTINSGNSLTVSSGYDLTIIDAIVNNGTLTLENNANLIQTNPTAVNTGNIIVKRQTNPLIRLDYTMWSSPVTGQGLYAFSPFTFDNRFYVYNTTTNLYNNSSIGFTITGLNGAGVNGTDTSNVPFTTGKGYLIRLPYNHPTAPIIWNGSFTGVPNNGTKTITLANVSATQQFNAVGNPYPSPINIAQFATDNAANIEPTLYFWRKTNNAASPSYCTWNTASATFGDNGEAYTTTPNGIIQAGQGFIVEAKDGATSLEFNNGQRVANNTNQFFRNTATDTPTNESHRIWLNLIGTGAQYSQAVVGYFTNATLAADEYDSKYFNDGALALNMVIGSTEYVIQGRPTPFQATDIVPLNYKVTTAGTYTFVIDHVDGLFTSGAQPIYLKDNLNLSYQDLNVGAYSFTSDAGTFNNRFEIVYTLPLGVEHSNFTHSSLIIYNQNSDMIINSGSTIMASVKVFDIRGRLLQELKEINANQTSIRAGLANEVLLIQVTSIDGIVVTKKVI